MYVSDVIISMKEVADMALKIAEGLEKAIEDEKFNQLDDHRKIEENIHVAYWTMGFERAHYHAHESEHNLVAKLMKVAREYHFERGI